MGKKNWTPQPSTPQPFEHREHVAEQHAEQHVDMRMVLHTLMEELSKVVGGPQAFDKTKAALKRL